MPLQRCPSTGLLSSKVGVALGSFVGSLVEGEPLGPAVGDPVAGFKVGAALGFGLFAAGASLGFSEGDEELGGSAEGGDWLLPLLLGGSTVGSREVSVGVAVMVTRSNSRVVVVVSAWEASAGRKASVHSVIRSHPLVTHHRHSAVASRCCCHGC